MGQQRPAQADACRAGWIPEARKNTTAEIHIATGGAAALNRRLFQRQAPCSVSDDAEITRLSIATIAVPAAGPNTTAAVSVKTSEIEKFTETDGILRTADPLIKVSATSAHHCSGG